MSLIPLNPQTLAQHAKGTQEVAVSTYLERAKEWLATAVEVTGPEQIAMAKAEIATAAEATKQLNLSKEIQLDALEMVRRAEFALGKAIRKGQAEGVIATRGDIGSAGTPGVRGFATGVHRGEDLVRPTDAAGGVQTTTLSDFYAMADAEDFDAAIEEAKEEGNLSRNNVVRKIKAKGCERPQTRDAKADLINTLAARGYTSRQMAPEVGVSDARVREIARAYDIDIPADRIVGKQRRIDHTQMVDSTVTDLVNTTEFIEAHIDLNQVDFAEADEWVSSLTNSIAALTRFRKQIKEKTHV